MTQEMPKSFFDLLQSSEKPVLVDFYADWCGPCKMVSPAIARIAQEQKAGLLTVKVNVDKKPKLSSFYQISSIPTIVLFKDGNPIMRLQGAHSYEDLSREIEKALNQNLS